MQDEICINTSCYCKAVCQSFRRDADEDQPMTINTCVNEYGCDKYTPIGVVSGRFLSFTDSEERAYRLQGGYDGTNE